MRKLASVQKIIDIRPIEGADRIVVANVLGWECVIKKDEFRVGDLIVYIEVDAKVPKDNPKFEFLKDRNYRVKTIKLRKQVSQGLVIGLDVLPKGKYKEGDDVTEILGITKHDPQYEKEQKLLNRQMEKRNKFVKFMCRYEWFRKLFIKSNNNLSNFPDFITKTDETRIQNYARVLENKDKFFQCCEKLDGQSATYALLRSKEKKWFGLVEKEVFDFIVCSRNWRLKNEDNSSYWTIARDLKMKEVLKGLIGDEQFVIIQGEIIGEGIQSNRYGVEGYDFYAFNLIYPSGKVDSQIAKQRLNKRMIKFVPILKTDFKLMKTVKEMVEYSKGKSVINPKVHREGLVIRDPENKISFKVINPDFLLKYED